MTKCYCGGKGNLINNGGIYSVRCNRCGRRTGEFGVMDKALLAWDIMNGINPAPEKIVEVANTPEPENPAKKTRKKVAKNG